MAGHGEKLGGLGRSELKKLNKHNFFAASWSSLYKLISKFSLFFFSSPRPGDMICLFDAPCSHIISRRRLFFLLFYGDGDDGIPNEKVSFFFLRFGI